MAPDSAKPWWRNGSIHHIAVLVLLFVVGLGFAICDYLEPESAWSSMRWIRTILFSVCAGWTVVVSSVTLLLFRLVTKRPATPLRVWLVYLVVTPVVINFVFDRIWF